MNRMYGVAGRLSRALSIGSLLLLFGCGGGGGGGGTTAATQGTLSGTAVEGPVNGATVTAYAISNGAIGAQIATGTTDASGNFSLSMGSYAGPVMLQLSGGSYTDEATGQTMSVGAGNVMTSLIPSVTAGSTVSGIQLTPLTSMAQTLAQGMSGGMTAANISAANSAVGNYFSVSDILNTAPMNPLVSGSGSSASQAAINYGMVLSAMSEYAKEQGLSSSSAVVTAMMNDASDGTLNGMMGSSTVRMGGMGMMPASAGTSGLANAMAAFMNSTQNQSGVAVSAMQSLMNQLSGSNGQLTGSSGSNSSGSSGSGSSGSGGQTTQNGMIGGTATKGPVSGATVAAYAINNGAMGAQIGATTTDASGNFSLPVGSYSGPVMLQMSGGSYTDEATGQTMSVGTGNVMTALIPSVTAGSTVSGIQLTPLTSMAQTMAQGMSGGMTTANISAANSAVGNYFSVSDILHTAPMNPLVSNSGSSGSQDTINYGMVLAAMSEYANEQGLSSSSAVVTAMMNDASDGTLNGMSGSSPITMGAGMMGGGSMMQATAGTTGLANAMAAFMNSTQNQSGVAVSAMQSLMNQLSGSSGQLTGSSGSSGSGSSGSGGQTTQNGMIGGTATKGPVSGATVAAYAINNGVMGTQIGATTTDASGNFSLPIGSYSGPVMLQMSGGSYTDEATDQTMSVGAGNVMTALIPSVTAGQTLSGIQLTPLTSMAQTLAQGMSGGMTAANISAANSAVGNYFSVSDILDTAPMNPLVSGSGTSASQAARDYGLALAAMSEYANEQGLSSSSAVVTAMMNDASDGTLNGMSGSSPITMGAGMMGGGSVMQATAGTSGLGSAMTDFMNSTENMSGLTASDMNTLIQQLTSSNGQLVSTP